MATPARASALEILVVDDVRDNLVAIEAALHGLPQDGVVLANSGEEALRYLLDHDVALILLDIQMPSLNGLETARLIRQRERSRHVPIIFMTAYGQNEIELAGYRLGAVDFLFKPIKPDVLLAKVGVFVELQRRAAEVAHQAWLITQHEQQQRLQALSDQRRQLEAEALRRSLREQREYTAVLAATNSELENIRAQLERSNEQLAVADRRKDEFLAVLAHELRNPLAALMSGISALEARRDHASQQPVLSVMYRQAEHLTRLVDDLVDVSRITSGKMKLRKRALAVGEMLGAAVSLATLAIESGEHQLEVDDEQCAGVLVYGDSVRLAQAVSNLLINAARHSPPGSHIFLKAEREAPDSVLIIVEDDGRGMSSELISQVFDMFTQAEVSDGGLGVGLTLVRELTRMHGGDVSASSDGPGHGSRFEIRLPEHHGPNESDQPRRSPSSADSRRVALVDDNADVLSMTRIVLENWGHTVMVADTGTDGVELILAERPELAIVDVGLPDLDGYEVARRIRAALGGACPRLIAMTGYGQRRDRERAIAAGFDVHLCKPTTAEALRAALHGADRLGPRS